VSTKAFRFFGVAVLPVLIAGCGVKEQGSSSTLAIIQELSASPGVKPEFGTHLFSDVSTLVKRDDKDGGNYFGVYADNGRVTMAATLKDQGAPGSTNAPSPLNSITFTHYRVVYRRTDGHNIEGVDVPFAFDSGLTFTVFGGANASATFPIVRVTAKEEAPLRALTFSGGTINTIADVTFFGKDQANKDVQVTGSIDIAFSDFIDPTS